MRWVRPFEITDPEEGLSRPTDLSLRGLIGTGSSPGAQAKFGEPLPVPGRAELVELPGERERVRVPQHGRA